MIFINGYYVFVHILKHNICSKKQSVMTVSLDFIVIEISYLFHSNILAWVPDDHL